VLGKLSLKARSREARQKSSRLILEAEQEDGQAFTAVPGRSAQSRANATGKLPEVEIDRERKLSLNH